MEYRSLTWAGKRDFPVSGGEHFYGSGRKTFSCEVNINGYQPLKREKFRLHCSLYLPDGTESHGLLDDAAWGWEVAGQNGATKSDFISLPATLTFNFRKATGKLIMINISVIEVDSDPNAALFINGVSTSTFWVKSKRRLSSEDPPPRNETGFKRTFSDSSEQSQFYEGSIETVCKWTELVMSTMNKVKRSRCTDESDRDMLRQAMSQCHILKVYDALESLRQQESMIQQYNNSVNYSNIEDDDLQHLLTEFWDEAVADQERQRGSDADQSMQQLPDITKPTSQVKSSLRVPEASRLIDGPPSLSRIYSEGSSKGRVISQFIEKFAVRAPIASPPFMY